jgi:hypothetical protein
MAGLSIRDQKALFIGMEPAMRLSLWQDRLSAAVKETSSRKQKAVLRNISAQLDEKLFSDLNETALRKFGSFWSRYSEEAYQAFEPKSKALDAILTRLGTGKAAAPLPTKKARPSCTCASANNGDLRNNDCGGLSNACQTGACTPTRWGCGYLWLQGCDGLCTGEHFGSSRKKAASSRKQRAAA